MNKSDLSNQDLTSAATAAAANAAAAAATASTAASHAADNASAAATAASTAAASTAIISNDISWMKASLSKIEKSLAEIGGAFVSQVEFDEVKKMTQDHETRVRSIEKNIFTWMGSLAIIQTVAMIIISILIKFVK